MANRYVYFHHDLFTHIHIPQISTDLIGVKWGSTPGTHLLALDPGHWSSVDGKKFGNVMDEVAPVIPAGWEISKHWCALATDDDADGWQYATSFTSLSWFAKETDVINTCI